jgi:hypothetical protein
MNQDIKLRILTKYNCLRKIMIVLNMIKIIEIMGELSNKIKTKGIISNLA